MNVPKKLGPWKWGGQGQKDDAVADGEPEEGGWGLSWRILSWSPPESTFENSWNVSDLEMCRLTGDDDKDTKDSEEQVTPAISEDGSCEQSWRCF